MTKEVRTNFDMIKQRVNRMEDLINAILDYSRADRRVGDDERIDTNLLIKDTVDFIVKPDNSDLIIKNGKIGQVGKNLSCADCKIVEAAGKHLTAGIIDEHTHIALRGVNEGSKSISAEVRMGDVINPNDINIYRHLI